MDLILRGTMVRLVTPMAVELSIWMGVHGCGQPILIEGLIEGGHFLGCGVESAKFSFGGRRHHKLHYLGDQENWTIVLGERVIFGDEAVGTGLTGLTAAL
jgi:hypothetical protein